MKSTTYVFDPASAKLQTRVELYHDRIVDIQRMKLEDVRMVPSSIRIVVEDQWPGRNGSTVISLARAAGILVGRLGRTTETVEYLSPKSWKQTLCKGKAPKVKDFEAYMVHKAVCSLLDGDERKIYETFLRNTGNKDHKADVADTVGMALVAAGRV